jgi:outer membrane lipoprotein-sorting protein
MTKQMTYLARILLVLAVAGIAAAAQPIDTADGVIERMRENLYRIEDLDATITVETYADGEGDLSERLRLSLLQPDRMRQEYLAPDYLAGNLTLIVGDAMWIYIAAADTWYEKDLSELSTAEQPWLVFRQFLRGVKDEFEDYAFVLEGDAPGQYHLIGTSTTDDAAYGRIELWVDPETFVPTRRLLYDVDGNLLVELRILDVEQVAESTYLARTMETYDETGARKSVIHYDSLVVNGGLDPVLFAPPAEAGGG